MVKKDRGLFVLSVMCFVGGLGIGLYAMLDAAGWIGDHTVKSPLILERLTRAQSGDLIVYADKTICMIGSRPWWGWLDNRQQIAVQKIGVSCLPSRDSTYQSIGRIAGRGLYIPPQAVVGPEDPMYGMVAAQYLSQARR